MGVCSGKQQLEAQLGAELQPEEVGAGDAGRARFVEARRGNIRKDYDVDDKMLGDGGFATVFKARHKTSGKTRAVKVMDKSKAKAHRLKEEFTVMRSLDHPNVAKLYEMVEEDQYVNLAMELCEGGELLSFVSEQGSLTEGDASGAVQQIMRGVAYLHARDIVHRDLKPDNVLFAHEGPIESNVLKIIDFGFARKCSEGDSLKSLAGTADYMAPQVLTGSYDRQCDVWSMGVLTYILLCGYAPFRGNDDHDIFEKVRKGSFEFNKKHWAEVSNQAKFFISSLLKMHPKARPTANAALSHKWFDEDSPDRCRELPKTLLANLRSFRSHNKFKKAALRAIAGELDEEHIAGLRTAFFALDARGDGTLSSDELREVLQDADLGLNDEDVKGIVDGMDSSGSGSVDYTEFLAAAIEKRLCTEEDVCRTAFAMFDRDGDGKISAQDLHSVLHECRASRRASTLAVISAADKNGEGGVNFDDFVAMMQRQSVVMRASRASGAVVVE